MVAIVTAVFAALPTGVPELIQGGIVTLLVSGLRALIGESEWAEWGPALRLALVGVVAVLWAGAIGWAAGLWGVPLTTHMVGAAVAAVGLRQAIKMPQKLRLARANDPLRGLHAKRPRS